jgi:D-alanyl-D-alanine carboxypeptidase/D-alanyl-D-alanine-endopeptidase (penicillin-binding protein 4)
MTARGATVAEAVAQATSAPPFDTAIWFVLIEDEDGNVVHELNATKLAIPASVRKLFSAATAAECLALDREIETELWVSGEDVVIRGGGDPSFGSERYYLPEESALEPFVRKLRERGVVRVRDVIGDVSLFDRVTIPFQWKVGNIVGSAAAPVDAIVWSENDIESYAVASAGHFAALAFRDALMAAGIEVTGEIRLQTEPAQWENLVAVHRSPMVFELLATMLKPSHNLFAETLYKLSGATGEPASYDAARDRERRFLTNDVGIAESSFRFVDGSGLAPDDLVTPHAVVRMLRWMNDPRRRAIYWNLLAVPGEREGTLRSRLVPLADRLRAKTGTVAGVSSLAGIIRGRQGGHRYFAVMVNHHIGSSGAASRLIDAIVEAAADF